MDNLGRSIVDIIAGGGGTQYLSELKDVTILGAPSDGQILNFNAGAGKWTNSTPGLMRGLLSVYTTTPVASYGVSVGFNAGTVVLYDMALTRIGGVVTLAMNGAFDVGGAAVASATVQLANAGLNTIGGLPDVPVVGRNLAGSVSVTPITSQLANFPIVYPKINIDTSGNLNLQLYAAQTWGGSAGAFNGTYNFFWTCSYPSANY